MGKADLRRKNRVHRRYFKGLLRTAVTGIPVAQRTASPHRASLRRRSPRPWASARHSVETGDPFTLAQSRLHYPTQERILGPPMEATAPARTHKGTWPPEAIRGLPAPATSRSTAGWGTLLLAGGGAAPGPPERSSPENPLPPVPPERRPSGLPRWNSLAPPPSAVRPPSTLLRPTPSAAIPPEVLPPEPV